jgi:hypothetical protein
VHLSESDEALSRPSHDVENSAKYRPHRPQGSKSADLQGFVRAVFSLGTDRKSDIPTADSSLSTVGISIARNIDRAGILAFAGVSYSVDRLRSMRSMRSMYCRLSRPLR